jgi:imidazolonepropionase-like amidohydrolase
MKIHSKTIRKQLLSKEKGYFKLIIVIAVMTILPFAALSQIKSNKASDSLNEIKNNQPAENILVIENVSVIDAVNPTVQPNKTIVMAGNRIKAIGEKGKVSIPRKSKIINGKGKYLIPGLWDSHVHLNGKEIFLPLFIANGITSVREMGGDFQNLKQIREQVANGQLIGPKIKTAGPFIESDRWIKWVNDLAKKDDDVKALEDYSRRIAIGNPEQAKEAVKKLAEEGVDLIKVRNTQTPETFLAILAEAKKYGLPVAAHAPPMDLTVASAAGLGSIEHTDSSLSMRNQDVQKIARSFAQNGTWYTPTFVSGINVRLTPKETLLKSLNDVDGKLDPRNHYMPLAILQSWKKTIERLNQNNGSLDWEAQTRRGISEFRLMQKEGVGVLAGTDYGVLLIYPGFSLHDELEALVREGGLTPFEALQAATKNPPYFFNLQNEIGTIETGKIADLVLLEANPLESISNTKKVAGVVQNGKHFSQTDLQKLLNTVREQIKKENEKRKTK